MQIQYENAQGEITDINNGKIRIVSVTGLSPVSVINTSTISGYDGADYISSQMPMRNITLLLEVLGDAEVNKQKLYAIFQVKQRGTLYCRSDSRNVKIQCYTEKIDSTLTSNSMEFQVSLLCPQPYFESLHVMTGSIASVIPMFKFPFCPQREGFYVSRKSNSFMVTINNPGEVDIGMTIIFAANIAVENPSLLNANTGELLRLETEMLAGDTVTITTHRGNKRVTRTRNGEDANFFNFLTPESVFLPLHRGNNLFRYNADTNLAGLEVTIYYSEYYAGV